MSRRLPRATPEERAERLARARARVELFSQGVKPRMALFGAAATAAATARPEGTTKPAAKPRIELFGSASGLNATGLARAERGTKTVEEA